MNGLMVNLAHSDQQELMNKVFLPTGQVVMFMFIHFLSAPMEGNVPTVFIVEL